MTDCILLKDSMKACVEAEEAAYMVQNDVDDVDEEVTEELDDAFFKYHTAAKPLLKLFKEAEILTVVDAESIRAANEAEQAKRDEAAARAAAEAEAAEGSDDESSEDEFSRPTTAGGSRPSTALSSGRAKPEFQAIAEKAPEPLPGNVLLLDALDKVLNPVVMELPESGIDPVLAATVLKNYEGKKSCEELPRECQCCIRPLRPDTPQLPCAAQVTRPYC